MGETAQTNDYRDLVLQFSVAKKSSERTPTKLLAAAIGGREATGANEERPTSQQILVAATARTKVDELSKQNECHQSHSSKHIYFPFEGTEITLNQQERDAQIVLTSEF